MQEPIKLAETSSFQPFSFTKLPNLDIGVAKSGVNGPFNIGSNSDRFYGWVSEVNRRNRGSYNAQSQ